MDTKGHGVMANVLLACGGDDVYEPSGSWVAIATPFKDDESVNYDVFEQIVNFHAENGTSALLVMGSTGEPTVLEIEERREIIDRVTRMARGKIPVFFGTTCGSTKATIALTRYAEDCGADGAVLVVPFGAGQRAALTGLATSVGVVGLAWLARTGRRRLRVTPTQLGLLGLALLAALLVPVVVQAATGTWAGGGTGTGTGAGTSTGAAAGAGAWDGYAATAVAESAERALITDGPVEVHVEDRPSLYAP
jgi:hypothetical protein